MITVKPLSFELQKMRWNCSHPKTFSIKDHYKQKGNNDHNRWHWHIEEVTGCSVWKLGFKMVLKGWKTICNQRNRLKELWCNPFMFSPYAAGGWFGQYKMMQKRWKRTETLAFGFSFESTQLELSNEYQHDRAEMVYKGLCLLKLLTKIALALEGLSVPPWVVIFKEPWNFRQ